MERSDLNEYFNTSSIKTLKIIERLVKETADPFTLNLLFRIQIDCYLFLTSTQN